MSTKGPPAWLYLLLATAAVMGAWILAWESPSSRRTSTQPEPEAPAEAKPKAGPKSWTPRALPPEHAPAEPGCTPQEDTLCIRGDAWWVDSCGNPHEKAEECGPALCEEGVCVGPDPACAGMGAGRCEDDVAVGCAAGRVYRRDCAELGRVCVITEEGAACRSSDGVPCLLGAPSRCDGDVLVSCVDGLEQRLTCADVGAQCLPLRGGRADACVRPGAAPQRPGCGACGCEPDPQTEEVCNGRDDDGDGFVDEGVECGVVDLVAVVVADAAGNTDYTEADLDAELARINAFFAREDDLGLTFRWADVVYLDAEAWLEIDDAELQTVLTGSAHLRQRESFYIPIVFTRTLRVDDVPRPGLATPPNGICGGVRRVQSRQPIVGGVIIAKQRWESTVAHELGHYLGLCHTHAPSVDVVSTLSEEGQPCREPCDLEGDGICDTPLDPGPGGCQVGESCQLVCEGTDTPDPSNVMGYYPGCRVGFSAEQAAVVREGLAWRRGWYACVFEPCTCRPAEGDCPEGMTCSPYDAEQGAARWQCRLDGPAPPGAPCSSPDACNGGLCVQQAGGASTCARMCNAQTPDCECAPLPGIDTPLCLDDLSADE